MTVDREEGVDIQQLVRSKKVRLRKSEDEIKEFKVRDLKASQLKRIKNKVNGKTVCHEQKKPFSTRERDQYFNQLILDDESVFPYYYKKEEKKEEDSLQRDKEAEREEAQDRQLRRDFDEWMARRYRLVADVKNMELNCEWLMRKPVRTQAEQRVMETLMLANKRKAERKKMHEARQNNKHKSHRFEDTFYSKKNSRESRFETNKQLLQKIQVQAMASSESSFHLPPLQTAELAQLKRERRSVEYNTDAHGNLIVRNENVRIPSHLLSKDELMRSVELARQKVGIEKLTKASFLKKIRSSESSENVDPLRNLINIYPNIDDVVPEKEEMKLSTGQAFVEPKVNCWMTFEEMKEKLKKYGKDFTPKMHNYTLSNRAYWPGTSDNVINQSDDGKSNSLFHHTGTNRRNHGNVVKCTWPVGDHKLIYGDITRGRSYQVGWNDL